MLEAISVSIILGGISAHLTDTYAPDEGYNQIHDSLGIDLEYKNYGLTAFRFDDSYNKPSHTVLGNYGYRFGNEFNTKVGVFGGYLDTSYYSGAYGGLFVEPCYKNICIQGSFVPKTTITDSTIMMQLKIRFEQWTLQ